MPFSAGSHVNVKRRYAIYWGLIDVKLLPSAPGWKGPSDCAVIHVLIPLSIGLADPELFRYARYSATHLLKAQLPAHGYELQYLDEFKYFEDVQWQSAEEAEFYLALSARAQETRQLQLGRIHFYTAEDADG